MGVDSCRNHLIPPPPLRRHPVDIDPDDRHGGIGDEHRVRLWRDPHGILKTLPLVALCRHMATTYVLPFSSFLIPGREGIIQILQGASAAGWFTPSQLADFSKIYTKKYVRKDC